MLAARGASGSPSPEIKCSSNCGSFREPDRGSLRVQRIPAPAEVRDDGLYQHGQLEEDLLENPRILLGQTRGQKQVHGNLDGQWDFPWPGGTDRGSSPPYSSCPGERARPRAPGAPSTCARGPPGPGLCSPPQCWSLVRNGHPGPSAKTGRRPRTRGRWPGTFPGTPWPCRGGRRRRGPAENQDPQESGR